jgi:hypothetical protein
LEERCKCTSVPNLDQRPDPWDSYVFRPSGPASGSVPKCHGSATLLKNKEKEEKFIFGRAEYPLWKAGGYTRGLEVLHASAQKYIMSLLI